MSVISVTYKPVPLKLSPVLRRSISPQGLYKNTNDPEANYSHSRVTRIVHWKHTVNAEKDLEKNMNCSRREHSHPRWPCVHWTSLPLSFHKCGNIYGRRDGTTGSANNTISSPLRQSDDRILKSSRATRCNGCRSIRWPVNQILTSDL